MNATPACKPISRSLYAWEIEEVRRVFAGQLQYERIRVHECAGWPNRINRIGAKLKGMDPSKLQPNAITLGNHCYFPVNLLEQRVTPEHPEHYKIGWLVHELTHAWQYQHLGWRYLLMALSAQLRLKDKAYQYGGAQGLIESFKAGRKLAFFNPEQQGDITRDYYLHLSKNESVEAWEPYIQQFQGFA
jgi:hypothetical protein